MEMKINNALQQAVNYKLPDDLKKAILDELWKIMLENKIPHGERCEDGIGTICAIPEWTSVKHVFLESVSSDLEIEILLNSPEHLLNKENMDEHLQS